MPVRDNEPRALDEWMAEVETRLRQLEARSLAAGEGAELDQATDTVSAKISEDAGNTARIGSDGGIYATTTTATTSPCIEVIGDGTAANPVTAAPVFSATAGNAVTCEADGLFVPQIFPREFEAVYAQRTTDAAVANGTTVDFISAPVITVVTAVRVRVTICWGAIFSAAEGDRMDMQISEGGVALRFATVAVGTATANADCDGGCYAAEFTSNPGAHTYTFSGFGRTGSPTLEASATHPASIRVEDARW